MGWSTHPLANEEKVKWQTAMKFLIPVKFDVTRAIELYRAHEVRRKRGRGMMNALNENSSSYLGSSSKRTSRSNIDH